jgi:hypothetical protein
VTVIYREHEAPAQVMAHGAAFRRAKNASGVGYAVAVTPVGSPQRPSEQIVLLVGSRSVTVTATGISAAKAKALAAKLASLL